MLMVIILHWGKDLTIQPVPSVQHVHDMKRRLNLPDTDYIIHESHLLCPVKFDTAIREFAESEIIEWMHTTVWPALVEEGRARKNRYGKYELIKENKIKIR